MNTLDGGGGVADHAAKASLYDTLAESAKLLRRGYGWLYCENSLARRSHFGALK